MLASSLACARSLTPAIPRAVARAQVGDDSVPFFADALREAWAPQSVREGWGAADADAEAAEAAEEEAPGDAPSSAPLDVASAADGDVALSARSRAVPLDEQTFTAIANASVRVTMLARRGGGDEKAVASASTPLVALVETGELRSTLTLSSTLGAAAEGLSLIRI